MSDKLLDLTPESARAIFLRNDLRPESGHVAIEDGCCCIIGAILADEEIMLNHESVSSAAPALNLEFYSANRFAAGFDDGLTDSAKSIFHTPHYDHGYLIGQSLRDLR